MTSEHYMCVDSGLWKGGIFTSNGMVWWYDSLLRTGRYSLQPRNSSCWFHWLDLQSGRCQCRWWPGSHQNRPQSVHWWQRCEEEHQKVDYDREKICALHVLLLVCVYITPVHADLPVGGRAQRDPGNLTSVVAAVSPTKDHFTALIVALLYIKQQTSDLMWSDTHAVS